MLAIFIREVFISRRHDIFTNLIRMIDEILTIKAPDIGKRVSRDIIRSFCLINVKTVINSFFLR